MIQESEIYIYIYIYICVCVCVCACACACRSKSEIDSLKGTPLLIFQSRSLRLLANAYLEWDQDQHWQKALNAVGLANAVSFYITLICCISTYQSSDMTLRVSFYQLFFKF